MSKLVCIGFGYCARHFVAGFGPRFQRIVGTTRDPHKIAEPPVELLMFDSAHPSEPMRQAVTEASHLLMLEAIAGRPLLERSYAAAVASGYRWHEFGDLHLLLR